jgi:glycosyltransferase involved in cell wall biosynthesis
MLTFKMNTPRRKYNTTDKHYRFCFVISSYNNERNIYNNLLSVIKQDYPNWRAIYINDCSTDKTERMFFDIVNKYRVSDKFVYIKNDKQMHQMYNKFHAYKLVEVDEIVCILDGDDWLAHNNVLQTLCVKYKNSDSQVITSNFNSFVNGEIVATQLYHPFYKNTNRIRQTKQYLFRHLKTGYGRLFKAIPEEYLQYNGEWLDMCTDLAEMFSVAELAGGKVSQIDDVLYIYNADNSIQYANSWFNSAKSKRRVDIHEYLYSLPPLQRLTT